MLEPKSGPVWKAASLLLLGDRDGIFGFDFRNQVKELGIREVLRVPRGPRQRAYIERVIGTIRRECLDHVIVFDEAPLCRPPAIVPGVLSRHSYSFVAGEGHTGESAGGAARAGVHGKQYRRSAACIIGTNVEQRDSKRAGNYSSQCI